MGRITKRFFSGEDKYGERCLFIGSYGYRSERHKYFEAVFLFTWDYICFTFEGLFFGSSGDCFTSGLQMGQNGLEGLCCRLRGRFMTGLMDFGCLAVFLRLFLNMMP